MASGKAQIREELEKAFFIDEKNKKTLLDLMDSIPLFALETLLNTIRKHNESVDAYIKTAIDADPKIVDEFKKKTRLIKTKINKMKEEEESSSSEENLNKLLKKV
jgi:hypothetical protein